MRTRLTWPFDWFDWTTFAFYSVREISPFVYGGWGDFIAPLYWATFSFVSTFYVVHIFWLVNLVIWSSLELTNSFVSFFNLKNNLKASGFARFTTAYISKFYHDDSFSRSFVSYIVQVWL